ncbi:toll-like receptor 1 [Fundulus heteroclitus]|uniref:toll-like receptor 1 n=1 Tax=Fundulus heteroclitus TaxID=8078 RepID=UPI00165C8D81|nr:toll-like receptor 1 [Fundulus heteroclitus]XP_035983385.1 toll-like receptor 1 [Fundulus heteroclitus]XP_035983386.1 toll-like receptor 1 [Fundulus heteroclitus]
MRPSAAFLWAAAILVVPQMCASSSDSNVDRSSKNLSSVPADLPLTAERVDLSRNHIHQLHTGDFKNVGLLRFLNMSWNGLELIEAETFLDTPLLEDLDLSHNVLRNLSDQRFLLHTGNLRVINLAWNEFLNMTLGREFNALRKLETLTLGARAISSGDFRNIAMVKLHRLTLSLEEELDYEATSLMDIHAEKIQLDLNGGQITQGDLIADVLLFFEEVELRNVTGSYEQVRTQLRQRANITTVSISISVFEVDWRDLTELVNAILHTSIANLSASDAAILNPPYADTIITGPSLMESFTVARGVVKSFFFSQEALYDFFINLPAKQFAIVETSLIHMTCPKNLSPIVELDFSYCTLSDSMFSTIQGQETVECETLSNVEKLSLVGNNLKSLQLVSKRLQNMTSLKHLDLSINAFVYDGSSECFWPKNITFMNLSSGGVTDDVFNCLPQGVKILDLQNNQISVVPSTIFKLGNLSSLNLNANRLRDLPPCRIFPQITELLLRSNSLHAPSLRNLGSCSSLKILDASNNPFTCSCPLRHFIRLGVQTESERGLELLNWPEGYYCIYPEDLRDTKLESVWIPEISCSPSLLAATILVPSVILIISVFFLCQRLDAPWYIGMIWQWTRAKHRARVRQLRPEDMVGIEFHAFVSYSQHDEDWVKNFLLLNLEGPGGGLRICHHEKNFVPGKTIMENIITCVEKSRRSVFVLSAHFVKSEWCHYELYFASHQRLSQGSDSIVLVLLEPLPQYLIPSKYYQLKSMMSRHTYLEWPQDKAKHRLFWANLRAALQSNLPSEQVAQTEE